MRKLVLILAILLILPGLVKAGFWDQIKDTVKGVATKSTTSPAETSSFSAEEVSKGLIEALHIGSEKAVSLAASEGGFLNNPLIHIPLPENLQTVATSLRRIGLGSQMDRFEGTLNAAAEKASSEALPILTQSIKEMTFDDAMRVWKGDDTAITRYFEEKTRQPIYEKYKPVVQEAVQQAGVTSSYQSLVSRPTVRAVATGMNLNTDMNEYVTEKALDGLFTLLAEEEKQIRNNPVARTTDLLKKLFTK